MVRLIVLLALLASCCVNDARGAEAAPDYVTIKRGYLIYHLDLQAHICFACPSWKCRALTPIAFNDCNKLIAYWAPEHALR